MIQKADYQFLREENDKDNNNRMIAKRYRVSFCDDKKKCSEIDHGDGLNSRIYLKKNINCTV